VVDVDGTRQAARQHALPQAQSLPAPHRRFDQVCAPGYQGRKRGEVVRTRTVMLQAHTHQFLGTFGGPGNEDYRGELRQAIGVIKNYATKLGLSTFK
jgi:FPC/CPF motif-containing protein YcgG